MSAWMDGSGRPIADADDYIFDLSGCPFYRSKGKLPGCTNCHDAPACYEERPVEGWPSELATDDEAVASLRGGGLSPDPERNTE